MNPNQDGRHFILMASGLFLRPGTPSHSMPQNSAFPGALAQSTNLRPPRAAELKSPYPGIHIGSGNELLDFRFDETELLEGREE